MNLQEKYKSRCEQTARTMTRLYNTRLTTTSGGNISLRLDDELFCITPSGLDKSCLTAQDIAIVTMDGENLTPNLKLSIESEMHRILLLSRPDIKAVVHAHPCWGSMFSTFTDLRINTALTAESYFLLGEPAFIPYHRMGTPELAAEVAKAMGGCNAGIMENHGVITVGKSLVAAFDLIEVLENAARMTIAAKMLNGAAAVKALDENQRRELDEMKAAKRKGD